MITQNNLKEVFDNLPQSDIEYCFDYQEHDLLILSVSIFNSGFVAHLDNATIFNGKAHEPEGALLTTKDELIEIFKESGSNNPYLLEYC